MENAYKLELKGVSKYFPGVKALENVNIRIRKGTVHVIVGENGAGKSTLMKVINGIYRPEEGKMYLDGREAMPANALDARRMGISMIFQELNYVPDITIAENIFLGKEPTTKLGVLDRKKIYGDTETLLEAEGLPYDSRTKMRQLTVSDIQMIEIIKAISSDASVIIMDEPTSAISNLEVERLFKKIAELKANGITILYISHKMDEIFRIADDITVMRDGKTIATRPARELDINGVITMMVGRKMEDVYPKRTHELGETVFQVKGYHARRLFRDISFSVRRGEVLGVSGLMGSGRTEVARAIVGLDESDGGSCVVEGKEYRFKSIADACKHGVVMSTEDRQVYGIVGVRSVKENATLASLDLFTRLASIDKRREREAVWSEIRELNIKTPTMDTKIESLSGGNQQKVILARWLMSGPKVMIMDEPTRGIDVGAKHEIYKLIRKLAQQGVAVVMISSELPELIGMCDRMVIMRQGEVVGELDRESFSQESIMALQIGVDSCE